MNANTYKRMRDCYIKLWSYMEIKPEWYPKVAHIAQKIYTYKKRYELLEDVPYFVVGCIHYRESNFNFSTHLHNGDPLTWWTVNVPKGRPIGKEPPFRWEDSAIDALQMKRNIMPKKWDIFGTLFFLEAYNGFGYSRYRNINSPYLWSGSNHYEKGKYKSDSNFDPELIDKQVGCACIIKYGITHELWEI